MVNESAASSAIIVKNLLSLLEAVICWILVSHQAWLSISMRAGGQYYVIIGFRHSPQTFCTQSVFGHLFFNTI
jgi:hypothetical protein